MRGEQNLLDGCSWQYEENSDERLIRIIIELLANVVLEVNE